MSSISLISGIPGKNNNTVPRKLLQNNKNVIKNVTNFVCCFSNISKCLIKLHASNIDPLVIEGLSYIGKSHCKYNQKPQSQMFTYFTNIS